MSQDIDENELMSSDCYGVIIGDDLPDSAYVSERLDAIEKLFSAPQQTEAQIVEQRAKEARSKFEESVSRNELPSYRDLLDVMRLELRTKNSDRGLKNENRICLSVKKEYRRYFREIVLRILSDRMPHRKFDILSKMSVDPTYFTKMMDTMVKDGLIVLAGREMIPKKRSCGQSVWISVDAEKPARCNSRSSRFSCGLVVADRNLHV